VACRWRVELRIVAPMKSQVFLLNAEQLGAGAALDPAVGALWEAAGLGGCFRENDLAAVKLHVGEPGVATALEPRLAAAFVRCLARTGAQAFLTDTAVLYRSPRNTGPGHARVALERGFGMAEVGAPFVPADGVIGADEVEVTVNEKHFETAAVAAGIAQARSLLLLSHATGHLGTGLAAALKNLGMGCASRKAKLRQHHGQHPRIDPDHCTACGECAEWCPSDAIQVAEAAGIDTELCIGCGECVAVCREGAVTFGWGIQGQELQERVVEHAAAVVRGKPGRIAYVTAATQITKDCDCLGLEQEPLVEDIGLLASLDPVAIDAAVLDLVNERAGRSLESLSYPHHDGRTQIRYAEQLGLGSTDYELVEVIV
jgi:uncharacterized Fe-S center protein